MHLLFDVAAMLRPCEALTSCALSGLCGGWWSCMHWLQRAQFQPPTGPAPDTSLRMTLSYDGHVMLCIISGMRVAVVSTSTATAFHVFKATR